MGRHYHCKLIALSLLMVCPASAKEFSVSDQDQINVAAICEIAARASTIQLDAIAQIATWCSQWKQRVQAANAPKPVEPAPEEKK